MIAAAELVRRLEEAADPNDPRAPAWDLLELARRAVRDLSVAEGTLQDVRAELRDAAEELRDAEGERDRAEKALAEARETLAQIAKIVEIDVWPEALDYHRRLVERVRERCGVRRG